MLLVRAHQEESRHATLLARLPTRKARQLISWSEGRKLLRYNFFMLQADVLPNMGFSATRKRLIQSWDCTSDSNFATKKEKNEVDGVEGGYDFSSGEL